jgi:hypothetical protein
MDKEKTISKKYIIYGIFGVVLLMNIFLFPDLLNHEDIKLNDLSYIIPEVKTIEAAPMAKPEIINKAESIQPQEVTKLETKAEAPVPAIEKVIQPKSNGYLIILLLLLFSCLGSFAYYSYKHRDQINLLRLPTKHARKIESQKVYFEDGYQLLID